jgi:hypothetical protein
MENFDQNFTLLEEDEGIGLNLDILNRFNKYFGVSQF